jgi:cytochrome c oxidase assembly factor CtaG
MIYLFILGVPMMVVAALITFTGEPLYQWYVEAPRIFPLSPHEDQRLGGVIMWVPGALTLWVGITLVYFRWTHREVRDEEERLEVGKSGLIISPPPFPEHTLK